MIVYLIVMTDSKLASRSPGRPVDPTARLERSSRILAGARQCFIQNGFHKASIGDIAAAAGVSVANIYQYFENKDAMILALVEANLEAERQLAASVAATRFEPVALRRALESLFLTEHGVETARMRKEMLSEGTRNHAVAAVVRSADDASIFNIAQSLASSQRQGIIPADVDTNEAAHVLGYMFEGLLTRFAVDPSSGARLMDLFVRALLRLLQLTNR
jgi:TetR/AcrR family transcriptional regulator, repressor for uid operon